MAEPSLALNVDFNKCFSGLFESFEQNITSINNLKREVEKLKANLETRVATDIIHYPVGLELLEGHSAATRENITRIALPNNINIIGPWGGQVRSSFDFGRNSSRITRIDLHTRTVVDGLEIHHVADRDEVKTFRVGGYGGPSASIWLN